ncbi:hypothetical protein PF003_g40458 [Phytophthora fragariae]|nr:hypothetical protein PF003_g40458 [Phytophthora fragariae]
MQGYGYSQYQAHSPHHQRSDQAQRRNRGTSTTSPSAPR